MNLEKFRTPPKLDKFSIYLDKFRTTWFTDVVVAGCDGRELLMQEQAHSLATSENIERFWTAVATFLSAKVAKGPSCISTFFSMAGASCRKRKSVFISPKHKIKVPTSDGYSSCVRGANSAALFLIFDLEPCFATATKERKSSTKLKHCQTKIFN